MNRANRNISAACFTSGAACPLRPGASLASERELPRRRRLAHRLHDAKSSVAGLIGNPRREGKQALLTPFVAVDDQIGGAQPEHVSALQNLVPVDDVADLARHVRHRGMADRYRAENAKLRQLVRGRRLRLCGPAWDL